MMPFLAGIVGMQTLAAYGADSGVRSYQAITRLAIDINPILGGLALAAVLAAVISSGGPILLSSATMLVRDWMPGHERLSEPARLRALRIATVLYGIVAALIAWRGEITSILDLLLLGFAMVVPPAVALGYVLYWRGTTERGCFWGIATGYGLSLAWYLAIRWATAAEWTASEGSGILARFADRCFANGGIDPSYPATLIPLVVIPIVSLLDKTQEDPAQRDEFYRLLATKN